MSLKVIYIMGSPRSGSTLLNTILGDCTGVFAAGELCNMVSAMDLAHSFCACGIVSNQCSFWSRVRTRWAGIGGGVDGPAFLRLQSRFEHLRRYQHRPWRRWDRDSMFDVYVTQTQALFRAIAEVSNATTIVDSSKSPVRAVVLARTPNIDLRVIHLVRDVRGVASSLMKSFDSNPEGGIRSPIAGKNPMRTAVEWLRLNSLANHVRLMLHDRAALVRYEDLVMNPKATLERISLFSGVDFTSVFEKLERSEALRPGHVIEGNRLRMQRHIRLKPDVRWRSELSAVQRYLLPFLAGPVAWRYGYRPGP